MEEERNSDQLGTVVVLLFNPNGFAGSALGFTPGG